MTPTMRLIFAALSLTCAAAAPGEAQARLADRQSGTPPRSVLERPARLSVRGLPLLEALEQLSKQSGVIVAFSPSLVDESDRRVTCDCADATVRSALDQLLRGTGFDYVVVRGQIVLFLGAAPSPAESLVLVRLPALAEAQGQRPEPADLRLVEVRQTRPIAGVVLDGRGGTVTGATVTLVGPGVQAVTDKDGRFRLEGPAQPQVTLRVTAIGYRPLTQTVAPGIELRLVVSEAPVNLSEVVVTGTPGGTEKRALGNSVGQINASDVVELAPVTNLAQLLNARVAGVSVQTATGIVGSGARINVRGQSSLVFAGEPLLYVDGVRMDNAASTGPGTAGGRVISRFNDINPNDIDRIEIIKGPAAATLYGTEASNGVIQIITKQGRAMERAEIGTTIRQGANWFMDPEGRWPTWYGRDATGQIVSRNHAMAESERGTPLFQTGHLQGYGLNVTGGSEALRYYAATEFDRDNGIEPTNRAERFSGRANLSFSPRGSLRLSANTGFTSGRTKLSREEGTSVISSALNFNPARLATTRGFNIPPEVIWEAFDLAQDIRRFTSGLTVQHGPASWFNQRLTAGVDFLDEENDFLVPFMRPEIAGFFDPTTASGSRLVDRRVVLNTTLDYSGTITARIGTKLSSSTSFGGQYYRKAITLNSLSGTTFPAPGVTTVGGATIRTANEDFIENVTIGMYAQQQFSWRDRLYVTGALRADDNSAFGANFDVVTYPKVSASWVLSEEPFFKKISLVNVLKLRAAFGASGQQPDNFASLRTFQPVVGPGGVAGVTPQLLGNPDLKPERGEELELGFEASLFDQRVGIDFTYFNQTTKDAILLRDVAFSTGFPGQQFVNIGKVENRGLELLVKALALDSKTVDVDVAFSLSTNKNKVVELGLANAQFLTGGIGGTLRKQPGYPIQAIFTRRVTSAELDANGVPINVLCDGGDGNAPVPCATAPRVYIGQVTPRTEGSFSTTVTLFDRLRIYGLVDFKTGYRRFDNTTQFAPCSASRICEENFFPQRFDPKRIAEIQGGIDFSWVYPDASFAKLREVAVNYAMPRSWSRALRARQGSLTVSLRNLHTWTGHPSLDPETTLIGSVNPSGNQADQALTPIPASLMVTLNLVF